MLLILFRMPAVYPNIPGASTSVLFLFVSLSEQTACYVDFLPIFALFRPFTTCFT